MENIFPGKMKAKRNLLVTDHYKKMGPMQLPFFQLASKIHFKVPTRSSGRSSLIADVSTTVLQSFSSHALKKKTL